MRAVNRIYDKVCVFPFYQAHTLLFLFFFLIMFGAIDARNLIQFHYTLLVAGFSSPPMLGIFMVFWLLYMANAYHSIVTSMQKPENHLLSLSAGLPSGLLNWTLARTILYIDAPVFIYILIGIGIGFYHSFVLCYLLAILFLILTVLIRVYLLRQRLLYAHKPVKLTFDISLFNIRFKPSVFSITLRHLIRERKLMLIAVKVFSCLLLYAAHYEWDSFGYDIRWMEIALSPAMAAHGILMLGIWSFDCEYLSFTRGLPQQLWWRYAQILLLTSLLLLPEMILLLSYSVRFGVVMQYDVFLLFMISVPMFQYALLYSGEFDTEGYHSILFALVLISFFVSLFGLGWLLAVLFLLVSFLIFVYSYYAFEKKVDQLDN